MIWNNLDEALSLGALDDLTFRSIYFGQMALAESCRQLKLIRRERGVTQQELAQVVGSTQQSISRWERGDVGNVSLSFLARIAAALEVQPRIDFTGYHTSNSA